MAKGLFTQGICVLLREPVAIAELENRLQSLGFAGRHESLDDDEAPQTLVYDYRPEVNGHLLVTPASGKWPDDMGDPDESPERFIAWSLGQLGPLAFPGCLQRAGEQSWGWEEGSEQIQEHRAHIRLLISYVLGVDDPEDVDDDRPLVPDDYNALDELNFLMRAVSLLLEMPQAICYFNPGGEVLRDDDGLRRGLNHAWNHNHPPLDMWTNVRLFRATDTWSLMDTVGNGQFDLPDLEAIYRTNQYEPAQIEGFLRNASQYMLNEEAEIEDGDTADGPGDVIWRAMECFDALSDPPRPTIRWIPDDGSEPPAALLDPGEEPPEIEDEDLYDEDDDEVDFDDDDDDVDFDDEELDDDEHEDYQP
jgi:Domain of unknown function (DUF4261)